MIINIETDIGTLEAEVVEENADQYKIKLNNGEVWVNKDKCISKKYEFKDDIILNDLNFNFENNNQDMNSSVNNNKRLGSERDMSLKSKVLARLNYKKIADEIYDILESDIEDAVIENIEDSDIAETLAKEYASDLIEIAQEIVVESISNDINITRIEDEFSDLISEIVNND